MTDIRVGIRLDADGKGFRGEMRLSRQDLEKLTASVRDGEGEGRRYARATREVERATRRASVPHAWATVSFHTRPGRFTLRNWFARVNAGSLE